jgi:hypothetical protein
MKSSKFLRGAVVAVLFGASSMVGIAVVAGASSTSTTITPVSSTCTAGWVNNGTTGCYKVTTLTQVACQGDHGAWTKGATVGNCVIGISYGVHPCPAGWTDNGSTGCYTNLTFPSVAVCQINGGVWNGGTVGNCLRGLSYNTAAPKRK